MNAPRLGASLIIIALAILIAAIGSPRQVDVLAAFVASGGSVPKAAARVGIRPSTAKRHLADLRARSDLRPSS